jgi:xylulose-5-phosphate/fructose-6-phosphate phosphoketolase
MKGIGREADALWRAAVYLVVALLHLDDNLLLRRRLAGGDVKSRPAGHWGTVPGTAWVLSHVALAAGRVPRSRELVPVIGAGHAGVVQLALAWLTGDLARLRPQFGRDLAGLTRLARWFPEADGLGCEVHPGLPGGSYLGGWLGGALAFAQGAAVDGPGRIVVPILGDGECETPTTAAAWLAARELPNGAVLPIVHLNGFRMGARSMLSTMTDAQLDAYTAGLGWKARVFRIRQGGLDEHAEFHELLRQAIDATTGGQRTVIVLRCVKGWGGPPAVGGRRLLGTPDLHKTPLLAPRHDPGQRQQLQEWLASYRPAELFDADGHPAGRLASAVREMRLRNLDRPQVGVEGCGPMHARHFDCSPMPFTRCCGCTLPTAG